MRSRGRPLLGATRPAPTGGRQPRPRGGSRGLRADFRVTARCSTERNASNAEDVMKKAAIVIVAAAAALFTPTLAAVGEARASMAAGGEPTSAGVLDEMVAKLAAAERDWEAAFISTM